MFEVYLCYWYNGASCCTLILRKTSEDFTEMVNDYGEVMFTVYSGTELHKRMRELDAGEHA